MIHILQILLTSVCSVSQSALTKIASGKVKTQGSMFFNALKAGAALLFFFLISIYNMQLHIPTLIYAAIYGVALFFSSIFGYLALMRGSMALTSLLVSYSVVIPCLFGVIFLNESMSYIQVIGIALLLVSMYLIKFQREKVKLNKHWLIYVAITFFSNGVCSVIQKLHQTSYPGQFCNEYMVFSLLVTFCLFLVISIFKREVGNGSGVTLFAIVAGVLMGLTNYLTLILAARVDATVLFPMITIISMLCNVALSRFFFKDRFSIIQFIGIALGVASVLLIK